MHEKLVWQGKHFAFFQNKMCEYFPCHAGADKDNFNCLFCYCPLYVLGKECGGYPTWSDSGVKDCSFCLLPHRPENYGYINEQLNKILEVLKSGIEETSLSLI